MSTTQKYHPPLKNWRIWKIAQTHVNQISNNLLPKPIILIFYLLCRWI